MNKCIEYRREFHKYPENGWSEIRTSSRVAELLLGMGIDTILMGEDVVDTALLETKPIDLSQENRERNIARAISQGAREDLARKTNGYPGVIAIIDTCKPGPTFALRFDMDSLPYTEEADNTCPSMMYDYSSTNANAVHACGHDAHTAIGLCLAEEIIKNTQEFCGKIKLIFQPAEEIVAGAASIVSKGHLNDVDYFFAVHLALSSENQPLPSHTIACGCKDFLSHRQLDVTFHGLAAHPCGAAQEGKNAILAACTAVMNLHSIAPHEKGLCRVNVGEIHGGVCSNTIAPECSIKLEFRGEYQIISDYLNTRVFNILEGAAKCHDVNFTYVDYGEVPSGKSDDEMMEIIQEEASNIPWFKKIYFEGNLGGTDDAAVMLNCVQSHGGKGTYIGIGTDIRRPLHHPGFDFDESCLMPTVDLLANTLRRCWN